MEKTDSTQAWNISEKKYHESELHQMWGTCSCKITTLCWLSMVLRTQNTEVILTDCNTSITPKKYTNKEIVHSEVLALRNVEEDTAQKLAFYSQNNSVLDVCFWITNSPCHECQAMILEKMKMIQSQSPKSFLRLILFFSNLYRKNPDGCSKNSNEQKTDEALERLKDWFLNLAKENISILVGSLVVSRVVPKPETHKIPLLTKRKKRDLHSLVYFRKMLRKIKPRLSEIKFTCDYGGDVFSNIPVDENILDEISPNSCPYISIYPVEFPLLSMLTPLIGLWFLILDFCLLILFFFRLSLSEFWQDLLTA